jgi:hypothetical protein
MVVLPYLAVGGLLYLMAQNASKLKAAGGSSGASLPAAGTAGNNAGCNDFGVTPGCSWSC